MTERAKRWVSRAKWAALWCVPIWLCLAVDTYYHYHDSWTRFEHLKIAGVLVNMLFKGAWTGMHNYSEPTITIYSAIVYYVLTLIVVLVVGGIRRRWQAMDSPDYPD
jgi:hypothetical protein